MESMIQDKNMSPEYVQKASNGRLELLDLFKFVAAIFVVSLHTNFLSAYGIAQNIFQDIFSAGAVPFFFIVSGYFIGGKIDLFLTEWGGL